MLGSTARKLRILGFDTTYDPLLDDSTLLESAATSGRILVTADVELFLRARRKRVPAICSGSKMERDRLYEILASIGEKQIDFRSTFSRCTACNGILKDSGEVLDEKATFVCKSCGKNYWRGGHWKQLDKLFAEVNLMLRSASS
jgi:uncharacterized protein with PIN domain